MDVTIDLIFFDQVEEEAEPQLSPQEEQQDGKKYKYKVSWLISTKWGS